MVVKSVYQDRVTVLFTDSNGDILRKHVASNSEQMKEDPRFQKLDWTKSQRAQCDSGMPFTSETAVLPKEADAEVNNFFPPGSMEPDRQRKILNGLEAAAVHGHAPTACVSFNIGRTGKQTVHYEVSHSKGVMSEADYVKFHKSTQLEVNPDGEPRVPRGKKAYVKTPRGKS